MRLKGSIIFVVLCSLATPSAAHAASALFARGYTVVPQPQQVTLGTHDFTFGADWHLSTGSSIDTDDVALTTLREDLQNRFQVKLGTLRASGGVLSLQVSPGSVKIGAAQDSSKQELEQQAYRINLESKAVSITANTTLGLFYGVETFIQLLKPGAHSLSFPEGTIVDWPDLELRHIYWDDNHHLEHVAELKRAIRQAAFYKINGFVIKLDGHFQYKAAPAAVEPYALTSAELQQLTDYALRYHVQLIPYLDGPAHISFLLKHPEYAQLREFPDSNYEICATNPASYRLLEGMYQDLLNANKGVKYFYLSTDEPYYLGLAHNSQCNEQDLMTQLGSPGKVFAHFVNSTAGYLHERGRTVMFWGEYPLKPADISSLPSYLVNAEVQGPELDKAFHQHGIQQMIFISLEGEEKLFPDYSLLAPNQRLHQGKPTDDFEDYTTTPRVDDVMATIAKDPARSNTSIIGEVTCGWADEGVHPETFWLGYVAGGAAGWHPGSPSPEELEQSFYSLFYGHDVVEMDRIYRLLSEQAQSWADSWDPVASKVRKPLWGSPYDTIPTPAHDQTLPLPPVPATDLNYGSTWLRDNARRIALAARAEQENDKLLSLLDADIPRAQFNRYNLKVYVTIARLIHQNWDMIADIARMDEDLASASRLRSTHPAEALAKMDQALDSATSIWQERNRDLQNATAIWDESWFPRVSDANGRHFLNEVDDVKDHLPGRTVDMSYLVYRELLLPFGDWVTSLAATRNRFAAAKGFPARSYTLAWDDISVSRR